MTNHDVPAPEPANTAPSTDDDVDVFDTPSTSADASSDVIIINDDFEVVGRVRGDTLLLGIRSPDEHVDVAGSPTFAELFARGLETGRPASCASCHRPRGAFGEPAAFIVIRNTSSSSNGPDAPRHGFAPVCSACVNKNVGNVNRAMIEAISTLV
jgi:hypothetical protein